MQQLLSELEGRHGVRLADGVQFISVAGVVTRPVDPGMCLALLPDGPLEVPAGGDFTPSVLPGRHAHGAEPVELLRRLYGADHPVLSLGEAADTTLSGMDPAALAAQAWLLPAVREQDALASPYGLPWLVARLRAPDGCPWDREQDHLTLRPFLLEETYEVYDALEAGSSAELAGELGDLLLQIVLHAQYASEVGVFDLSDVYRGVMAKIIRRHPHVFGDMEASSSASVIRNWEQIKATERADGPPPREDMPAAFAGLSGSLPALAYASEMQGRAASLGYDWPDTSGVIEKIAEEAGELAGADSAAHRHEEFGDLLFVIVNLGRRLGIDAEAALRAASRKFAARFAIVERIAAGEGLDLRTMNPDALDELWRRAKAGEVVA